MANEGECGLRNSGIDPTMTIGHASKCRRVKESYSSRLPNLTIHPRSNSEKFMQNAKNKGRLQRLISRITIGASLLAWILLMFSTNSAASASLCQLSNVASTYPHQALPNQQIQVSTNVAGSCASNGEDYFAVRVDLVDKLSNSMPSSNSVPVGYNAKNFSVTVENHAVTPHENVTWPLEIDVYVLESGGLAGKYLLRVDNATIQVGNMSMPEFNLAPSSVIPLTLLVTVLVIRQRKTMQSRRRN